MGSHWRDHGLIANNAEKLVELSKKANWYSRQAPEYELFLNEFRRNAQELMKAGQQKELGRRIACLCSDDIELCKLSSIHSSKLPHRKLDRCRVVECGDAYHRDSFS